MRSVAPVMETITSYLRSNYGDDNPQSMVAMGNLAKVYFAIGETGKAIEICTELYQLTKKHSLPESMESRYAARSLAEMLLAEGQLDEAKEVVERWLTSVNTTTGFEIPYEKPCVYNALAEMSLVDGEFEEATKHAEQALSFQETAEDKDYYEFFRSKAILGKSIGHQNQAARANELLTEAFQGLTSDLKKIPSSHRWYAIRCCEWLIELAEVAADQDSVAKWNGELAEVRSEITAMRAEEIRA